MEMEKCKKGGMPMGIFLPFSATGGAPGWNSAGSRLNASARCAATTEGAYMGAVTQPVPLYREVDGWLGGMRLFGASVRFYAHNAGSSAGGRLNNCLPTSASTRPFLALVCWLLIASTAIPGLFVVGGYRCSLCKSPVWVQSFIWGFPLLAGKCFLSIAVR